MTRPSISGPRTLGRDVRVLLACSFLIPFGSFMVLPFIPIFMSRQLGLSMSMIGLLLAAMSFIQFGGAFLGGLLGEALGHKRAMVWALLVRSAGFGLLTASAWVPSLAIPSVLLIAAGAALYVPACKAYVVSAVPAPSQALALSLSNSAMNAGMGLGPLLGGLAIEGHAFPMFGIVTAVFVAVTALHGVFTRARPSAQGQGARFIPRPAEVAQLTGPLLLNALVFYTYFFFQNFLGPYATHFHPAWIYAWLLVANAVIVIAAQPLLSNLVRRHDFTLVLALGFPMMVAGVLAMTRAAAPMLFAGTALISVAEAALFLKLELEFMDRMPDRPAIAFGWQRLSSGVGAGASGVVGGVLYETLQAANAVNHFWSWVAGQSLFLALLSMGLWRGLPKRRA